MLSRSKLFSFHDGLREIPKPDFCPDFIVNSSGDKETVTCYLVRRSIGLLEADTRREGTHWGCFLEKGNLPQ